MSFVLFGITKETIAHCALPAGFEMDLSMQKPQLTYRTLDTAMQAEHATSQRLRNLRSSLHLWLDHLRLSDDMPIGTEMLGEFEKALNKFLQSLQTQKLSPQTIKDKKSHLRRWCELAERLSCIRQEDVEGSTQFVRILRTLVEDSKTPPKTIARLAGVDPATFYRWLSGAIPNIRVRAGLHRLEEYFGVRRGMLVELVRWSDERDMSQTNEPAISPIAYRGRLSAASQKPYYLKVASDSLKAEWSALVRYKTSTYIFDLKRQAKGVWRARPHEDLSCEYNTWSAMVSHDKASPSAAIYWSLTSSILGWLSMPESEGGRGISQNEAGTLAWLAIKDVVTGHLKWLLSRSDNLMHRGLELRCQFILSLVHPSTGYLTQQPGMALCLPASARPVSWEAACAETYVALKEFKQAISIQGKPSRDPFEPIATILCASQPLRHIVELTNTMKQDRLRMTPGSKKEAAHVRDLLLIFMLCANPLRSSQYQMMRYKNDNSGNLYQDKEGTWFIQFEPCDFKNEKGAARNKKYKMQIPKELTQLIGEYLTVYRPRLEVIQTDFVFVSSNARNQGRPWSNLNRVVERATKRYIPGSPGFGPHSFRHIVATDWLKSHPQDYPTVAVMLHDALETVLRHYGHLQAEDAFRPYRTHFSKLIDEYAE